MDLDEPVRADRHVRMDEKVGRNKMDELILAAIATKAGFIVIDGQEKILRPAIAIEDMITLAKDIIKHHEDGTLKGRDGNA